MKYDCSEKMVFRLYMQNQLTLEEYKAILVQLKECYEINSSASESNEMLSD